MSDRLWTSTESAAYGQEAPTADFDKPTNAGDRSGAEVEVYDPVGVLEPSDGPPSGTDDTSPADAEEGTSTDAAATEGTEGTDETSGTDADGQSDSPRENPLDELTAGKNFKAHYLDHRGLLEGTLDTRYPRWKEDQGAGFLGDLKNMIDSGRLEYQGLGTLGKDQPPARIFRGDGLTLVTRVNGEFWTLLESGQGKDLAIRPYSDPDSPGQTNPNPDT